MGLTTSDFFVQARFVPAPAAVLVLAAAWYVWSVRRLRRRGRSWPGARSACFAAFWLLLAVAVFSGLTAFGRSNFSAFGSQYIMVGLVAPLLLSCSAPLTLAAQSCSDPARVRWLQGRPLRILGNPFVTWIVFTVTTFVVFFTGLLQATIAGGAVQQAVFLWFLAAGWLFLWPAADADLAPVRISYWPRILYLLLTFPVFAILGMGLESQTVRPAPGISLDSLHLGGAVVWVVGEGMALCGALWVFVHWLRADERRARAKDEANPAAAARQLALWRASREAAARSASPR